MSDWGFGQSGAHERKMKALPVLLAPFQAQNALRRPCPKCGNLVMPALMAQHHAAYH